MSSFVYASDLHGNRESYDRLFELDADAVVRFPVAVQIGGVDEAGHRPILYRDDLSRGSLGHLSPDA